MTQAAQLIEAIRRKPMTHEKRKWTDMQLQTLAQKYPDADLDQLAAELEHSRSAVVKQANMRGIKRSGSAISATRKMAAKPNSGSFKPVHGRSWDGKSRTDRTYNTWLSMHQRCNYANHKSFQSYGGRGICVCPEWSDFRTFLADMGERPDGATLGRIDNDGNYCAANCRWETMKEQQRNRRSNRIIELDGVRKTLVEWSETVGIRHDTLAHRLNAGWDARRALSTPVEPRTRKAQ